MRRTKLSELSPNWTTTHAVAERGGEADAIAFNCPEADGGCGSRHVIPVTPDVDGQPTHGTRWQRAGDDLATMTITPSILCRGCCQMHVNITRGEILFHADSKSGPDWERK